ncbi:MAG: hypothetical protein JRI23_20745 [Deltaproteobacteria bacterium]|jgi:hypothetical protein|nr:hypothetical protein [Deltaproteobacteria bacterium]MBW2534333.1 hypothetical protein [Deltaproteobacteria bacterium]
MPQRGLALLTSALWLALVTGCASQKVFAPPSTAEPHAKMTLRFNNVRHEPNAPWGKKGFRPRAEICDGGKPGCGITWCYECDGDASERRWAISETSVGAELHVPAREITIVPYTNEKGDECRADPLVIAPKKGVAYELVYSHVWSKEGSSYRCAATVERQQPPAAKPKPKPDADADAAPPAGE